jgi:hypothetical protein
VLLDGTPAVVLGGQLTLWTTSGYTDRHVRPATGIAQVITPPSTLAVLAAGYPVQLDPAAR